PASGELRQHPVSGGLRRYRGHLRGAVERGRGGAGHTGGLQRCAAHPVFSAHTCCPVPPSLPPPHGRGAAWTVSPSSPSPRSTTTVSPSTTEPSSSARASRSPISRCTTRRSGRAP